MNLVIVESPTKAKTISKFLGDGYTIKASMGHIVDLPKSTLGVDVEHEFSPQYQVVEDKKNVISDIKKSAKSANSIILATDPDREGEAIASHVRDVLSSNSKFNPSTKLRTRIQNSKFQRIVFHEITKEAVEEALSNPRLINEDLVSAQTARRVLDRLVGYKLSPLLWQKVRRGLSAGRVQSIALRLIVEREREIGKFKKEQYWTINVLLRQNVIASPNETKAKQSQVDGIATDFLSPRNDNNQTTEFELIEINGEKIELQSSFQLYDGEYTITKTTIVSREQAKEILSDLQTKQYMVSEVSQKEIQRSPQPPYTTSTLQQSVSRALGFAGKRTMRAAQKLYEEGFITYHRTDSVVMAEAAKKDIRNFVIKEYGEKYAPEKPRFYATKQKLAQEAHEAIRPTHIGELQSQISNLKSQIGGDAVKLYELIWKRAVASQMSNAVTELTVVIVDASSSVILGTPPWRGTPESIETDSGQARMTNSNYKFKANGSVLVFDGFLKVNPYALEDKRLPEFKAEEKLNLQSVADQEHETQQPPRYNDASLIKTLEEKGIGRPSTYAPIISTIEDRNYIERQENKFVPTSIGVAVNDFLVKNFSDIDDIPFTAQMEDDLDEVANGEKDWVEMMGKFYKPFSQKLEEVKGTERVKIEVEQTDEKCEKCGSPLVIRMGRFGKFLACSQFPKCKFTKAFIEETNLNCPKDGGKIIIKKTKRGRKFFGCSNYPSCDFAAWKVETISQVLRTRPARS